MFLYCFVSFLHHFSELTLKIMLWLVTLQNLYMKAIISVHNIEWKDAAGMTSCTNHSLSAL